MSETRHNINVRFQKRKQVWQDQNSFATTLLTLFLDAYGTEALQWDPLTIQTEIEQDFDVKLSRSVFDRLMAGIAVLSTDSFFQSLPDFINLCNVLSGSLFDPSVFDPADAAECAWGMTEALMISPPEDDEQDPFAQEIVDYISEALKNEGILTPPDILRVSLRGDYVGMADKIKYDFSDDPEMFQAIFETEKAKTDDINAVVKERLRLLVGQLESIPLDNGDSSEVVKKLAASLPR